VLELRRPASIRGNTRPVVGPRLVLVGAEGNHGLNSKAHARLRLADSLVLGVVRDVGSAVEELVDAVAAVSFHDAAVAFLSDLFDRVAVVAEEGAGFDEFDRLFQAVAGGLDDAHAVRVLVGFADVVGFVQIAVEAAVVEGDVDVEDVAVLEGALVGDAVADDFVGGGADGFGEVAVVEWRRVGLGATLAGRSSGVYRPVNVLHAPCRPRGRPGRCSRW
jgi:hypothetical protein